MERNIVLNVTLYKMPHSNFKQRSYENNTGVGKCSCGQTFDYSSPRDMELKRKLHGRFCKNPPKGEQKLGIPMRATTFMEHQTDTSKRRRELHNKYIF